MSAISQLRHNRLQKLPVRLFQAINAFQLTEAIRSAIELDIFTAIGAGHTTARGGGEPLQYCRARRAILCDFLVVKRIPQ